MALGFNWLLILYSAESTCPSLPTELAGDFRYVLPLAQNAAQKIQETSKSHSYNPFFVGCDRVTHAVVNYAFRQFLEIFLTIFCNQLLYLET